MTRDGLIVYVHGARDARWAEPFDRLRTKIVQRAPTLHVTVAFLEHARPNLTQAVREMAAEGIDHIRIVPMFFGRGGHLREDMPRQLDEARAAAPAVRFEVTEAAGENEAVLDALAQFAVDTPATAIDG